MAFVDDGLASQPECWQRAAELAKRVDAAGPGETDPRAPTRSVVLP